MKIPKSETVINFLLSKGWKKELKDKYNFILFPPETLGIKRSDFQYVLPKYEDAEDYPEYIIRIVNSIAEIYHMKKWYLVDLLSQGLEEMEDEIRIKSAIVKMRA